MVKDIKEDSKLKWSCPRMALPLRGIILQGLDIEELTLTAWAFETF